MRLFASAQGPALSARGLHVYEWYAWQKNVEYSTSLSAPDTFSTGFGRHVVKELATLLLVGKVRRVKKGRTASEQ